MKCLKCEKELYKKYTKKFCSRTCAAIFNNINYPKRSKEKMNWPKCHSCNNNITKRKSGKFCSICILENKHIKNPITEKSIFEISKRKDANRFSVVRHHARKLYKSLLLEPKCESCGYNKHVEVCHKKPISTFPENALIKEINEKDNILLLCPNCHWEFDHGMLEIAGCGNRTHARPSSREHRL